MSLPVAYRVIAFDNWFLCRPRPRQCRLLMRWNLFFHSRRGFSLFRSFISMATIGTVLVDCWYFVKFVQSSKMLLLYSGIEGLIFLLVDVLSAIDGHWFNLWRSLGKFGWMFDRSTLICWNSSRVFTDLIVTNSYVIYVYAWELKWC